MNFKQQLSTAKAFVFDVDGVLTDGSLILLPGGEQVRTMNIRDGYALQLAVKKGFVVAIISGGKSESVIKRLQGLGIRDIYMGRSDKEEALSELCLIYDLKAEDILYMGDDMPDHKVMQIVGMPCCPADAATEIKAIAKYISPVSGGKGCVRDVLEQALKLQNKWTEEELLTINPQQSEQK